MAADSAGGTSRRGSASKQMSSVKERSHSLVSHHPDTGGESSALSASVSETPNPFLTAIPTVKLVASEIDDFETYLSMHRATQASGDASADPAGTYGCYSPLSTSFENWFRSVLVHLHVFAFVAVSSTLMSLVC